MGLRERNVDEQTGSASESSSAHCSEARAHSVAPGAVVWWPLSRRAVRRCCEIALATTPASPRGMSPWRCGSNEPNSAAMPRRTGSRAERGPPLVRARWADRTATRLAGSSSYEATPAPAWVTRLNSSERRRRRRGRAKTTPVSSPARQTLVWPTMVAGKGIQDGWSVPTRVPTAGSRSRAAA